MQKKNNQLSHYKNEQPTQNAGILFSTAISFIAVIICNSLLSLLGALVLSKNDDPTPLVPFVSTISMTVSAIIGGLITAKISKCGTFTSTIFSLGALTVLIMIATVITLKSREHTPLWQSLLLKIPVILGGWFGAFVGSYKRPRRSPYSKYK